MNKNHLAYLIEQYCITIKENKKELHKILTQMNLEKAHISSDFDTMLNGSAQNLVSKWKNHEKILRTELSYNVIPNYPNNILQTSLLLDAMINILDDLYDEVLTKEDMTLYVLEVLRVLALFNRQKLSQIERKKIADYFTKILYIALLESTYITKIQMASNSAEKLNYAIECYDGKAMDLDIFLELPLFELGVNPTIIESVVSFGNISRAVSIILKDINDLNHDVINKTTTPMILLSQNPQEVFKEYIQAFLEHYEHKSTTFQLTTKTPLEATLIHNIKEGIQASIRNYQKIQKNAIHRDK
jgi:hypothetical protein